MKFQPNFTCPIFNSLTDNFSIAKKINDAPLQKTISSMRNILEKCTDYIAELAFYISSFSKLGISMSNIF